MSTDTKEANMKYLEGIETSDGSYTSQNPNSSAYGKYQIIDSTFKDIAKTTGKSVEWLKSPEGQDYAMGKLYEQYQATLQRVDEPETKENIYTVHQLGRARAERYFSDTLVGKDYTIMWKNLTSKEQEKIDRTDHEAIKKAWVNRYRGGIV